jgi:DNA (cytosine-5)-methyltransferase 1
MSKLSVVSLFSGIGGVEVGLHRNGHQTLMFCENMEPAKAVLSHQFPDIPLYSDVRALKGLPDCDLVAAGFPCQDLSQAGRKQGIEGVKSGLVEVLFDLIRKKRTRKPEWLLIENVPYMLHLDGGSAMNMLIDNLEDLGYQWAYRVVDARSFGVPQRRPRVIMLASRKNDPKEVLYVDDARHPADDMRPSDIDESLVYGFYWTEGSRGVGWAREAVPPIKGGSGLGIPSAPAVWVPKENFVGTIDIRDAERLQGFPADWTLPIVEAGYRNNHRWTLVGNAVCAEVSTWIGSRLKKPGKYKLSKELEFIGTRWPKAAWGSKGKRYVSEASAWPLAREEQRLSDFIQYPLKPLSVRATRGFLSRAGVCTNVVYAERFISSLDEHAINTEAGLASVIYPIPALA